MGNLLVITGGSSGLGLALAESPPFEARTIDVSRSGPPDGSAIEHIPADLSDVSSWVDVSTRIAQIVSEEEPSRSVFIHAAGSLAPVGFAGEVESLAYIRNVLLNSAAGQVLGHGYLAAVQDVPGTHDIVMISSGAASTPYAGWSGYGAGKAALDQWVRCVGEEQKLRGGVRVSAIAPGVVDTAMQRKIRSVDERDFPRVGRFHDLYENDELTSPEESAERVWNVIESGLDPGTVTDVRHR